MPITEAYTGSRTINQVQWSLTQNNSGIASNTTSGVFQTFLDLSRLSPGQGVHFRTYERVTNADNQRVVYSANFVGPQSEPVWASPSLVLMNAWDMTLHYITLPTTGEVVSWSIRSIT